MSQAETEDAQVHQVHRSVLPFSVFSQSRQSLDLSTTSLPPCSYSERTHRGLADEDHENAEDRSSSSDVVKSRFGVFSKLFRNGDQKQALASTLAQRGAALFGRQYASARKSTDSHELGVSRSSMSLTDKRMEKGRPWFATAGPSTSAIPVSSEGADFPRSSGRSPFDDRDPGLPIDSHIYSLPPIPSRPASRLGLPASPWPSLPESAAVLSRSSSKEREAASASSTSPDPFVSYAADSSNTVSTAVAASLPNTLPGPEHDHDGGSAYDFQQQRRFNVFQSQTGGMRGFLVSSRHLNRSLSTVRESLTGNMSDSQREERLSAEAAREDREEEGEETKKEGDPLLIHRASLYAYDEEKTEKKGGWFNFFCGIIHPGERAPWDLWILLLLIWVIFACPIIVCFGLGGGYWEGEWLGIVEMCVDFFFLLDLYFNFRTAYIDQLGNLVTDRAAIARTYARSWMVFDILCVVPFDLITTQVFGLLSMMKVVRAQRIAKMIQLVSVYRMLRVAKLPRLMARLDAIIDKGLAQVFFFFLSIAILAHLAACLFYYIAFLENLDPDTWVAVYGAETDSLGFRYLISIYWAFSTIATVGYGDITPKTDPEIAFAIIAMVAGVAVVGYVTSSITSLLAIKNAIPEQAECRKQLMYNVMVNRQVPKELVRLVHLFFMYASTKELRNEENAIWAQLPPRLRGNIMRYVYGEILSRLIPVRQLPPPALEELVAALTIEYYSHGDIIAMQGDDVTSMYVVGEGILEVCSYELEPQDDSDNALYHQACHEEDLASVPCHRFGRMREKSFFGLFSAMYGGRWPATVVAHQCCELYSISVESLRKLSERWPQIRTALEAACVPPRGLEETASGGSKCTMTASSPVHFPSILADFPVLSAAKADVRGLNWLTHGFQSAFKTVTTVSFAVANMSMDVASALGRASTMPIKSPSVRTATDRSVKGGEESVIAA